MRKSSSKPSAKKAAPKSKKTKVSAKPESPRGLMWKILQQKQERQKLHDKMQSEAHVKMHEFDSQAKADHGGEFKRFAGPRRKAA